MLVSDHAALQPQFVQDVAGWIGSGELKYNETVVEGIENGFDAFIGLLRGENTGKMIVLASPDRLGPSRRGRGREPRRSTGGTSYVHPAVRRPVHRRRHGGERP